LSAKGPRDELGAKEFIAEACRLTDWYFEHFERLKDGRIEQLLSEETECGGS